MKQMNATFQLPKEAAALNPSAVMGKQEGIYFTFMSDLGTIAKIVPPPLEPAMPLVSGYIVEINEPAFAEPYREAMLGVYVKYGDTVGMYPVSFLLSGEGAEMATYLGREKTGLPKKMCFHKDDIRLIKEEGRMRGIVERKGVRLMDVSIQLGEYNNPATGNIYSNPEPGKKTGGTSFYFKPVISSNEEGISEFSDVSLISNEAEYTYQEWTPGKVSIRLQSGAEDAWGQMPVLENMGGAYAKCDLEMKELFVVAKPDPQEVMQYLMMSRFDRKAMV
jgi:acetoacetate decarboxylase